MRTSTGSAAHPLHDLVVRGGTVVDGTGAAPRRADVAIDGATITAVGDGVAPGRVEIDAVGAIITPGFVDLHTHLDAQIGWDPRLTPSSQHGVTTALLGNCGMGFAPVRPGAAGALATMMEAVEDIPAAAILSGLPWDWESFGDYLDTADRLRPALNVAGLVGHSPLRYYVMGDRAVDENPDRDERTRLAAAVTHALDAGAAGFSTSRYLGHRLPDGRFVPGTSAERAELLAIADAIGDRGLFQAVINDRSRRTEMELLTEVGRRGCRVLVIVGVGDETKTGRSVTSMFERFDAEGLDIVGMISPRPGGLVLGTGASLLPWRTPRWGKLHRSSVAERLEAFADREVRAALVAEADAAEPFVAAEHIYPLGLDAPEYTAGPESSLAAVAERAGETPAAYFVRVALESSGRAFYTARLFNRNLDAIGLALESERVLPGLGDAGAHVGQVMDAGWTTFWLSHWVRDTAAFGLAEGIRRITSLPAAVLGAGDRGRVATGLRADLNVIDLERLAAGPVEVVRDLPGDAARFTQGASGYRATIVNGAVTVVGDALTDARNGHVLRTFQSKERA